MIIEIINFTERKKETNKNLSRDYNEIVRKQNEKMKNDVHKLKLNIQSEKKTGLTARCTEEASNKQETKIKKNLMCYFDRITVYTNEHTHTQTHTEKI